MRRLAILIAMVHVLAGLALAGESPKERVRIQWQIFRVLGNFSGETKTEEPIWADKDSPSAELKATITLFTSGQFGLGSDQLAISPKGWFWNETALDFASDIPALPEDRIQRIASPSIEVQKGKSASIEVSSLQKLEYFERIEGDTFRLRRLEEPTGLKIEMDVKREAQERVLLVNLTLQLRSVEKREPISGLTLQIGRPILQTREHRVPVHLTLGKDYGILLNPGAGQGVLIMHLRAEPTSESPQPE